MIFKKPYAFLIKRFRLIHLILSGLILFILAKTYNIFSFFNRYVQNVYSTIGDATPTNYITIFMFLVSIFIISFSLAMYLLMKKKDKPKKLYIFMSFYYILMLVAFLVFFAIFRSAETSELSIRNAMVLRDTCIILILPQLVFLILSLIRGLGFDVKKFNFSKDLKELDILEEDNEEFEFILGVDSYKYFRKIRRKIREFKYYILENKIMFTILSSFTGVIVVFALFMNFTVFNHTYGTNQKFTANNLVVQVNDSYITNIDYSGNTIAKNKYFVIANVNFTNNSGSSTVLDLTNYVLSTKSGKIYPTLSRNEYFVDIGPGYSKEKIESGKSYNFILVYEINNKDVKNKYKMKIIDEVNYKLGSFHAKTKNISLKPIKYYEKSEPEEFETNEKMNFYNSILGNSSFEFNSYTFENKYVYNYQACTSIGCDDITDVVTADATKSKKLLIIDGALNLDYNSNFAQNNKTSMTFFDAFVQVKYNDKLTTVKDLTPISVTDKYILEVNEKVEKASKLSLIINVRNKQYILTIK